MKGRSFLISERCQQGVYVQTRSGGSIIDLTIAAPRLALKIGDWCVLEVITLSDHQ